MTDDHTNNTDNTSFHTEGDNGNNSGNSDNRHRPLRGIGELLASLPGTLGYHPRDCAVAVTLHDNPLTGAMTTGLILVTELDDLTAPGARILLPAHIAEDTTACVGVVISDGTEARIDACLAALDEQLSQQLRAHAVTAPNTQHGLNDQHGLDTRHSPADALDSDDPVLALYTLPEITGGQPVELVSAVHVVSGAESTLWRDQHAAPDHDCAGHDRVSTVAATESFGDYLARRGDLPALQRPGVDHTLAEANPRLSRAAAATLLTTALTERLTIQATAPLPDAQLRAAAEQAGPRSRAALEMRTAEHNHAHLVHNRGLSLLVDELGESLTDHGDGTISDAELLEDYQANHQLLRGTMLALSSTTVRDMLLAILYELSYHGHRGDLLMQAVISTVRAAGLDLPAEDAGVSTDADADSSTDTDHSALRDRATTIALNAACLQVLLTADQHPSVSGATTNLLRRGVLLHGGNDDARHLIQPTEVHPLSRLLVQAHLEGLLPRVTGGVINAAEDARTMFFDSCGPTCPVK